MRVLTFATDAQGCFPLLRSSARRFGFELEVLGWGEPWRGMASKMLRHGEYLRGVRPDETVMLVDAFDVFFDGPASETELAFKDLQVPILFSGQRYFPTSPLLRRWADRVMGLDVNGDFVRRLEAKPYGRPCMGALMGQAGALVELFCKLAELEERLHTNNDQILLNRYLAQCPEATHVDQQCRIFQNLWRTRRLFPLRGGIHPDDADAEVRVLPAGRLENRFTGTHPQVIHGPMHLDMDALIAAMGHDLAMLHPVSLSRYLRYGIGPYLKIMLQQGLEGLERLARRRNGAR